MKLVFSREAVTACSRGRSPWTLFPPDLQPRSGDSEPPFTETVTDAQRRDADAAVAASRLGRLRDANSVGFTHGYMLPPLRGSGHGRWRMETPPTFRIHTLSIAEARALLSFDTRTASWDAGAAWNTAATGVVAHLCD